MKDAKAAWSILKGDTLTYYITGYIDSWLFDDLVNEVNLSGADKLSLVINSPGGSILTAFGIYDWLKARQIEVTSYLFGYCASSATIISCVGEAHVSQNTFYLAHNAYYDVTDGITEQEQTTLNNIIDRMVEIYFAKSKKTRKWIRNALIEGDMGATFTADQVVEYGFAESIIDNKKSIAALKEFNVLASSNNTKTNNMDFQKALHDVLAFFGIGEVKTEQDQKEALAKVKYFVDKVNAQPDYNAAIQNLTEQLNASEEKIKGLDITSQLEGFKAEVADQIKTFTELNDALKAENDEKQKTIDEATKAHEAKVAELEKEIATIKANGSGVNTAQGQLNIGEGKAQKTTVAAGDFVNKYLNGQIKVN